MKIGNLLPVGSVVLLKNAKKKIVIIGIMQIKHTEDGRDIFYDYVGVPYPEGFIGAKTTLLFNHDSIKQIIFTGYSCEERTGFINVIQSVFEK